MLAQVAAGEDTDAPRFVADEATEELACRIGMRLGRCRATMMEGMMMWAGYRSRFKIP